MRSIAILPRPIGGPTQQAVPRAPTDERRAAIAKAARELIVEKGVEGLRTRDIARRVGINVATLHYHVPTKEALIELVADSLREEFMSQSIARPRQHLSARERMDMEFVDFRELVVDRFDILLVFSELIERARRDERIAAAIRPMQRKWHQMVRDLLTQGVIDGVYRDDLDPDSAATFIIGGMVNHFRSGLGDLAGLDRLVDELQRAIRNPAPQFRALEKSKLPRPRRQA